MGDVFDGSGDVVANEPYPFYAIDPSLGGFTTTGRRRAGKHRAVDGGGRRLLRDARSVSCGVGFVQTSAAKRIPGMIDDGAKRRRWLTQPAPSGRYTPSVETYQPRAVNRAAKA